MSLGGGGDVTSLPDTWVGNHPGLPGPARVLSSFSLTASMVSNRSPSFKERLIGPGILDEELSLAVCA
jgi:hypothetical protein